MAPFIIAFLLSLSPQQLQFLQKCQLSREKFSAVYVPAEFKESLNTLQLNLFMKSQIWKVPRGKYLKNSELSLMNIVLPEYGNKAMYRVQIQRDQKFLKLVQEAPEFLYTLNDQQKQILQHAIRNDILLKYFFVSISQEQLQEFENFIVELNREQEYEEVLQELQ